MEIVELTDLSDRQYWVDAIDQCEWSAAHFLAQLLREGRFSAVLGENGKLFLLKDGGKLISFATLTQQDCVADETMYPWIGFVFTTPDCRGNRYAGKLLDYIWLVARDMGYDRVYLATDHVGLYEKYGFTYLESRIDVYHEESRIYVREK
jgi:GNAT superfamily N-acetyltransferase